MENPSTTKNNFDEEADMRVSQMDIFEVQTLVTDNQEKAKPEEIIGDTGAQVQNILGKFGGDINRCLTMKRKHMETYVKDCIKETNKKFEQVWEMNKWERKKIDNEFSKKHMSTFQQLDMNIQKLDEEQEKSANNFQKQQKAFKLSKTDQSQALQAVRQLHEKFMKSLENAENSGYDLITKPDGELKKEIVIVQRKLMKNCLKYSSSCKTSD